MLFVDVTWFQQKHTHTHTLNMGRNSRRQRRLTAAVRAEVAVPKPTTRVQDIEMIELKGDDAFQDAADDVENGGNEAPERSRLQALLHKLFRHKETGPSQGSEDRLRE